MISTTSQNNASSNQYVYGARTQNPYQNPKIPRPYAVHPIHLVFNPISLIFSRSGTPNTLHTTWQAKHAQKDFERRKM